MKMHLINHPTASLSDFIFKNDHSDSFIDQVSVNCSKVLVLPIFLSIELFFLRLPQLLALQFSANQLAKDECSYKVNKLVNGIFDLFSIQFNSLRIHQKFISCQLHRELVLSHHNISLLKYASDELRNDYEFILSAIRENGGVLMYASRDLRNNREIVLAAIEKTNEALRYASDELKNNSEVVRAAVLKNFKTLSFASDELKNNHEFILSIVRLNGEALQYASTSLKNDSEIVLAAIKKNGYSLNFASDELKNNRAFILNVVGQNFRALNFVTPNLKNDRAIICNAIRQNSHLLMYVSNELKNCREIVLEAVRKNGLALHYASLELRNNREIVLEAVRQNGLALNYASGELRNNREIVLEAIGENDLALRYASTEIRDDQEIVLDVVRRNYILFEVVSDRLKNDYKIAFEVIRQNGNFLMHVSHELKNNRKIVLEAIRNNSNALTYVSDELKNDPEVVWDAFKKDFRVLRFASNELKNNREFILDVVRYNGLALDFVSSGLKNDYEIVLEAVRQNGLALNFASVELRNNREIVLLAVLKNPHAFEYASVELKNDFEIRSVLIYGRISDAFCSIGGKRYFPKPLTSALKDLQLPPLPEESSLDHLEGHLNQFIDSLQESHLALIRRELALNDTNCLQACKDNLLQFSQMMFQRVRSKVAYLGTPTAASHELDTFYNKIEFYLRHLDFFFSKQENQLPEAFIERLQLLQTQSACGARFQAELEQLFSINCISSESMILDKQLALISSSEAKKIIEGIAADSNVHTINILTWQLDAFLVGEKVLRDHLAHPIDESVLMEQFLLRHTAVNLIEQIQKALKVGSEIEALFRRYVEEHFSYELTREDVLELEREVESSWQRMLENKLKSFRNYKEAKSGLGPFAEFKNNNRRLLHECNLQPQEAEYQDESDLLISFEKVRVQALRHNMENAIKAYLFEKNNELYFNEEHNQWKRTTIAQVLEKMGILVTFENL